MARVAVQRHYDALRSAKDPWTSEIGSRTSASLRREAFTSAAGASSRAQLAGTLPARNLRKEKLPFFTAAGCGQRAPRASAPPGPPPRPSCHLSTSAWSDDRQGVRILWVLFDPEQCEVTQSSFPPGALLH